MKLTIKILTPAFKERVDLLIKQEMIDLGFIDDGAMQEHTLYKTKLMMAKAFWAGVAWVDNFPKEIAKPDTTTMTTKTMGERDGEPLIKWNGKIMLASTVDDIISFTEAPQVTKYEEI